MKKTTTTTNHLYASIRSIIEQARKNIIRNVNILMVYTYFDIGRKIVEDEQAGDKRAGYAKQTLQHLSKALTRDFGRGYSVDNLELMRSFYLEYGKTGPAVSVAAGKTQQLISETLYRISESKQIFLLSF